MNIFTELANGSEVIWYLCGSKYPTHSTISLFSNKQLDDHWGKSDISGSERWRINSFAPQYTINVTPCGSVPRCHSSDRGFFLVFGASTEQLEIRTRILIVWFQRKYLPLTQWLFVFVREADMTEKLSSYTLCMGVLN